MLKPPAGGYDNNTKIRNNIILCLPIVDNYTDTVFTHKANSYNNITKKYLINKKRNLIDPLKLKKKLFLIMFYFLYIVYNIIRRDIKIIRNTTCPSSTL